MKKPIYEMNAPSISNMATIESMIVEDNKEPEKPIDREKVREFS